MIKLKSTDTLQVLLAGAVTTNQCDLLASYSDVATDSKTCAPDSSDGTTNNTTAVAWVASPASGKVRHVSYASLYNADTASVTATVRINNGSSNRILCKLTLATGERIEFMDGVGFRVLGANGSVSSAASIADGDKGDIVVSSGGNAWSFDSGVVTAAAKTVLDDTTTAAMLVTLGAAPLTGVGQPFEIALSLSDLTTALTTGTNVGYFRPAFAATAVTCRASLLTASSSGIPTVDMNKNGSTMMTTNKLTIDASETTSLTAATAVGMTTTTWAIDDLIAFDIDVAGTGAKGLIVTVTGLRA